MTSLLVLLVFLSLATLAARRGAIDEMLVRAATPISVGLGAAVGPEGLGFLPPSVLEDLSPAVEVGILWLAASVGLRASSSILDSRPTLPVLARPIALAVMGAALAAAAVLLVLDAAALAGHALVAPWAALPAALLVGASLASVPGDGAASLARSLHATAAEVIALVVALGALWSWTGSGPAVVVVGIGLLSAALARLLAGQTGVAPVVAVLSAATLAAGLASIAQVPSGIAGFIAGLASGGMRTTRELLPWVFATERTVRGVVIVVLAASAGVSVTDLVAGAAMGAAAVVVLLVVNVVPLDDRPLFERLAATIAMSTTPVVLLAAFASSGVGPGRALLGPVLVAVALADAAAFSLSAVARGVRRRNGA